MTIQNQKSNFDRHETDWNVAHRPLFWRYTRNTGMQKIADNLMVMIADLHALTTLEDSKNIKEDSLALAITYLASRH